MQVKKKPKKTAKAVPEKSRKKKQPSEDQIKKQPFLKRMLFGEEKPDLSELEAGSTTILDILSPTTVDTKSRDYIIVDDVYHAYWKHWTLCWSLQGCSPDFTRKTDCMNHFSCALPETERGPDTFSAWHGWTPLLTLQPSPV